MAPWVSAQEMNQLFIDDPSVLVQLEKGGYSFQKWFDEASKPGRLSSKELYQSSPSYKSIVDSVSGDLDRLKDADPKLSVTMTKSHRLFDKRWLRSGFSHYELVGVVNRLDRRIFNPKSCGETRFIYRLAYSKLQRQHRVRSRLPLTFNVVTLNKKTNGKSCQTLAKSWSTMAGIAPKSLANRLLQPASPLGKTLIQANHLKSIELNMQSVRWPSTIRPDMGGYAEYLLRVFKLTRAGVFRPAALENTPDVELLKRNKKLKKELLAWILKSNSLQELDEGVLNLPEKFLAKKTTSVALHGRSRDFNKPFSQIFSDADFAGLKWKSHQTFKTPYAVMRRLDDLSCAGCHQGRTVAGFHFLGEDGLDTSPYNSIMTSQSPHFFGDQPRRLSYLTKLSKGEDGSEFRPFSDQPRVGGAGFGEHCSREVDPSFKAWQCEAGLKCQSFDMQPGSALGTCIEDGPHKVGSPCKVGEFRASTNPLKDKIVKVKQRSCENDLVCEDTSVGFPGGMCSGACKNLDGNSTLKVRGTPLAAPSPCSMDSTGASDSINPLIFAWPIMCVRAPKENAAPSNLVGMITFARERLRVRALAFPPISCFNLGSTVTLSPFDRVVCPNDSDG
jgi:hypothetical protein